MQRRAAIAAEFRPVCACAQPVASRRAFRINALHGPTRQILHFFPPCETTRNLFPIRPPVFRAPEIRRKKLRKFCASALVVSRAKIQFLVVRLRTGNVRAKQDPRRDPEQLHVHEICGKSSFRLYNLAPRAHNLCFRERNQVDILHACILEIPVRANPGGRAGRNAGRNLRCEDFA